MNSKNNKLLVLDMNSYTTYDHYEMIIIAEALCYLSTNCTLQCKGCLAALLSGPPVDLYSILGVGNNFTSKWPWLEKSGVSSPIASMGA